MLTDGLFGTPLHYLEQVTFSFYPNPGLDPRGRSNWGHLFGSSPEVAHTTQAASGSIQQLHLCLERKGKEDQKEPDWSGTIFLKDCGEKWRRISQGGTGTLRAQCLSSSIPKGSREDFDPDCSLLSPLELQLNWVLAMGRVSLELEGEGKEKEDPSSGDLIKFCSSLNIIFLICQERGLN